MGFSDKKQTVVLQQNVDVVFKAMVQVITGMKDYTIASSGPSTHQMHLTQGMSALSWGSDVLISMAAQGGDQTALTVEVKSKMPTELFVGGKHQKTIDAILADLRKVLG